MSFHPSAEALHHVLANNFRVLNRFRFQNVVDSGSTRSLGESFAQAGKLILSSAGDDFNGAYGQEFDADLASLEKIGAGGGDPGFVEELAELEIPDEPSE